jgi:hypothetical protein
VTNFVQVKVPDGLTALLWAGRQIEDLSTKMDMVSPGTPKRDTIEKQMEELSVGYGLASRVMSLLAVVERIEDVAGVTPQQKVVAVGIPEGMDQNFFGGHPGHSGLFLGTPSPLRSVARSAMTLNVQSRGLPEYLYESGSSSATVFGSGSSSATVFGSVDFGSSGFGSVVLANTTHPVYEGNEWSYSGQLLVDLGCLLSDGGLPGNSMEERVMNTIFLAILASEDLKLLPGVYDKHLDRMVAFVKNNEDAVKDKATLVKVLNAIRTGSKVPSETLEGFFGQQQYDVLKALWSVERLAFI